MVTKGNQTHVLIYMSPSLEFGIRNWRTGSCAAARKNYQKQSAGMPASVPEGQHDPTAHAQGSSCWKREADDHGII